MTQHDCMDHVTSYYHFKIPRNYNHILARRPLLLTPPSPLALGSCNHSSYHSQIPRHYAHVLAQRPPSLQNPTSLPSILARHPLDCEYPTPPVVRIRDISPDHSNYTSVLNWRTSSRGNLSTLSSLPASTSSVIDIPIPISPHSRHDVHPTNDSNGNSISAGESEPKDHQPHFSFLGHSGTLSEQKEKSASVPPGTQQATPAPDQRPAKYGNLHRNVEEVRRMVESNAYHSMYMDAIDALVEEGTRKLHEADEAHQSHILTVDIPALKMPAFPLTDTSHTITSSPITKLTNTADLKQFGLSDVEKIWAILNAKCNATMFTPLSTIDLQATSLSPHSNEIASAIHRFTEICDTISPTAQYRKRSCSWEPTAGLIESSPTPPVKRVKASVPVSSQPVDLHLSSRYTSPAPPSEAVPSVSTTSNLNELPPNPSSAESNPHSSAPVVIINPTRDPRPTSPSSSASNLSKQPLNSTQDSLADSNSPDETVGSSESVITVDATSDPRPASPSSSASNPSKQPSNSTQQSPVDSNSWEETTDGSVPVIIDDATQEETVGSSESVTTVDATSDPRPANSSSSASNPTKQPPNSSQQSSADSNSQEETANTPVVSDNTTSNPRLTSPSSSASNPSKQPLLNSTQDSLADSNSQDETVGSSESIITVDATSDPRPASPSSSASNSSKQPSNSTQQSPEETVGSSGSVTAVDATSDPRPANSSSSASNPTKQPPNSSQQSSADSNSQEETANTPVVSDNTTSNPRLTSPSSSASNPSKQPLNSTQDSLADSNSQDETVGSSESVITVDATSDPRPASPSSSASNPSKQPPNSAQQSPADSNSQETANTPVIIDNATANPRPTSPSSSASNPSKQPPNSTQQSPANSDSSFQETVGSSESVVDVDNNTPDTSVSTPPSSSPSINPKELPQQPPAESITAPKLTPVVIVPLTTQGPGHTNHRSTTPLSAPPEELTQHGEEDDPPPYQERQGKDGPPPRGAALASRKRTSGADIGPSGTRKRPKSAKVETAQNDNALEVEPSFEILEGQSIFTRKSAPPLSPSFQELTTIFSVLIRPKYLSSGGYVNDLNKLIAKKRIDAPRAMLPMLQDILPEIWVHVTYRPGNKQVASLAPPQTGSVPYMLDIGSKNWEKYAPDIFKASFLDIIDSCPRLFQMPWPHPFFDSEHVRLDMLTLGIDDLLGDRRAGGWTALQQMMCRSTEKGHHHWWDFKCAVSGGSKRIHQVLMDSIRTLQPDGGDLPEPGPDDSRQEIETKG
ncbi:hypothetical protein PGTUg99_000489 [Puccinia graminis f. sp. tritici]|uniref:Uncharacterized protein n=1 Tax=Puccinia graminis f. sp. tritici TaxID=56615 RepID=A0A5B0R5C9_PUCGR|nr:hypothetical protein PGTUg99_000489 [Puccinia graminis f. sp. tritici]